MAGLASLTRMFADFVSMQAANFTANAKRPVNLGVGSSIGGLMRSTSLLALTLQGQISYAVALARLSTSASATPGTTNPEVDSFIGAFGLPRNAANYATGGLLVEFSSPLGYAMTYPANSIAVADSGPSYMITTDTVFAAGSSGGTIPVESLTAGSASDVPANTLWTIQSGGSITAPLAQPVITNPAAIANGVDVEPDLAYIARFQEYMAGGNFGTSNALLARMTLLGPGTIAASVGDTLDSMGATSLANVSVFVGNLGSNAAASPAFVAQAQAELMTARAGGIVTLAYAAGIIAVTVTGTIQSDGTLPVATVLANATAALDAYIGNLGMVPIQYPGSIKALMVPYSLVSKTILNASGVAYVSNLVINGSTNDLAIPYGSMPAAGTPNLTVLAAA